MTTREQIVEEALEWIDTPWAHQGFAKGIGCDCVGLIRGVGKNVNALSSSEEELNKYMNYSRRPNPIQMRTNLKIFLNLIPRESAKIGDILWFRIEKDPKHLGIITEPGIVIHSSEGKNKVIEHLAANSMIRMTSAAFRYPNLVGN